MAWCSSSLARKQTESDEPYATLSSCELLQVGDEIIAIDTLRVANAEQLKSCLKGKVGTSVRVMGARNSVIHTCVLMSFLSQSIQL